MAKQKNPPTENTPPVDNAAAPEAPAPAPAAVNQAVSVGRIVHFHREVNTGNGVDLIPLPAIVIGFAAKESNLPPNSVDLGVHSKAGYETRFGVMYSEKPAAGKWSWGPKV